MTKFNRVFREKAILDEFIWNMLEGSETIDIEAILR